MGASGYTSPFEIPAAHEASERKKSQKYRKSKLLRGSYVFLGLQTISEPIGPQFDPVMYRSSPILLGLFLSTTRRHGSA